MKRTIVWCAWAALLATVPAHAAQEPPNAASQFGAVVDRYCVSCHNEKLKTADLVLSKADVSDPGKDSEIWEKVVTKLRFRAMPPAPAPRPDEAAYKSLLAYLTAELDRAAAAKPNPGRPAGAHRLNRTEYTNSIRDLLGLEIDGDSLLPADDSGGFDNLAEVLSVSPMLMEKYFSAATKISRLAVGDTSIRPDIVTYPVSPNLVQGGRMSEDLPFGTRGGVAIRHYFPLDGEYAFKARLMRTEGTGYVLGIAEPHFLDVRLDGVRVKLIQFGGEHVGRSPTGEDLEERDANQDQYERNADAGLEVRVPVKAGTRMVQVSFLNETSAAEGLFEKHSRVTLLDALRGVGDRQASDPDLSSLTIGGPFSISGPGDTPSRRKIFICSASSADDRTPPAKLASLRAGGRDENGGDKKDDKKQDACAERILSSLARRAYRGQATDADVRALVNLYRASRANGGFEAGIQGALEGLLVGPKFLFRVEREPKGIQPDTAYSVGDLEFASRLSFFLWSSIPDEELLVLAERGKLKDPETLEQQVRRMLADPKAKSLVDNFAGQWLLLRNVKTKTPNRDVYPEFDENLRQAFETETRLFLNALIKEDRPIPDLLGANYAYVNERLARHYGISNVYGSQFRRVIVADENRRGLLGQGSILLLTAYANRTSVVQRGKWVLESVLGVPVPPPPPNVPALKEKGQGGNGTLRQQMEAHRASPACMGCHSLMDPIGFSLENFDGIGKWRSSDDGIQIDPSGMLPDGAKFQGVAELRNALLSRPELLVNAVTEKLLMYALGRTLAGYDGPSIRKIVRDAASSEYRWSSVVLGIVKSTPFQMRRSRPS